MNVTGSVPVPSTGSWDNYQSFGKQGINLTGSVLEALGIPAECLWLDTDSLDDPSAEFRLLNCDAIWCGTSSPYRSMDGMLAGIQFARTRNRPFVAT